MAEPIRPTQQRLNELKQNREAIQVRLSDVDKLLAAGAPPDEVEAIRQELQDILSKIDKILAVYD